ncbi:MAG: glycosyltransferase family 39 protein [Candidatus Poribacteria bacterium]|nr:glycosyltransferase family 39 protein [Candidatus Poribacteria bacterium]
MVYGLSPGYPAVLALGVLFKVTWLVNPILGGLTIVCIFLLAKELYGDNTAKLSVVLACASSFFLFMSSEFASHTATLFFITVALLSFVWMIKTKVWTIFTNYSYKKQKSRYPFRTNQF